MKNSKEHLTIYGVWDNGNLTFTGSFSKLREFAIKQEEDSDKKKKMEKASETKVIEFLNEIDFEVEDLCEITKDDFTEQVIEVGVYYYTDDKGKKVYDTEEMTNEFETKLNQLI